MSELFRAFMASGCHGPSHLTRPHLVCLWPGEPGHYKGRRRREPFGAADRGCKRDITSRETQCYKGRIGGVAGELRDGSPLALLR
jgi:hypothetical protein